MAHVTYELDATRDGQHADHLGEIDRETFTGHAPGHSWEMRDLLHG
ncbi:hypothetical protein [Streptomyces sp. NPDC002176]